MVTTSKSVLPDVAILTLAVENVFRKLIRLLIGKISLKKASGNDPDNFC